MSKVVRTIIDEVAESAGAIKRFAGAGRPGETFTDRECFQHYGFTSRAKEGAEAIALLDGGNVYIIAEDDRSCRVSLEEGEVALYTDEGVKVHLKAGGAVEISGASSIKLGGDLAAVHKLIDARLIALFNSHTHTGVQTGSGSTGTPATQLTEAGCATSILEAE